MSAEKDSFKGLAVKGKRERKYMGAKRGHLNTEIYSKDPTEKRGVKSKNGLGNN